MNPKYPVYIPTKSRWDSRLTIKAFDLIGVPYKAVIEPQQVENYLKAGVKQDYILVLPHRDQGLVVTRNWIWDHAQATGTKRFWTFDDNIIQFYRLNRNSKIRMGCGTFLRVIEDFCDRYENLIIAGMQYENFAKRRDKLPPFLKNRRVYSNMLILTDARDPKGKLYRNEGFYNDDTDLCLRVLKDGFCTVQFYAFLADKEPTMKIAGGMTPHYQKGLDGGNGKESDGRYRMAKELQEKHPDVTTITWKFGHWQHQVDYSRFKRNELKLRDDIIIPDEINEYGMELREVTT